MNEKVLRNKTRIMSTLINKKKLLTRYLMTRSNLAHVVKAWLAAPGTNVAMAWARLLGHGYSSLAHSLMSLCGGCEEERFAQCELVSHVIVG